MANCSTENQLVQGKQMHTSTTGWEANYSDTCPRRVTAHVLSLAEETGVP